MTVTDAQPTRHVQGKVTLEPPGSDAPFDVSSHKCQLSQWDSLVYLVPIYGTISVHNWDRCRRA
jgi:hypothetical protein